MLMVIGRVVYFCLNFLPHIQNLGWRAVFYIEIMLKMIF